MCGQPSLTIFFWLESASFLIEGEVEKEKQQLDPTTDDTCLSNFKSPSKRKPRFHTRGELKGARLTRLIS